VPVGLKDMSVTEAKPHQRSLKRPAVVFSENARVNPAGLSVEAELGGIRVLRTGGPTMSVEEIDQAKRDGRV